MKKLITVGMDLGDRKHQLCFLDGKGNILETDSIPNTAKALRNRFSNIETICLNTFIKVIYDTQER